MVSIMLKIFRLKLKLKNAGPLLEHPLQFKIFVPGLIFSTPNHTRFTAFEQPIFDFWVNLKYLFFETTK